MIQRVRSYLARDGLVPVLTRTLAGSAGIRIIGMVFGFLVGVQLARGLGAEGYGIYGLAMSMISLAMVPAEFGLPQLLTREVAAAQVKKDWGRLRGITHWATRANFLISLVIALTVSVWLIVNSTINSTLGLTLLTGLLMVPLVGQTNIRGAVLRGLQHVVKGQLPGVLIQPALHSILLFIAPHLIAPLNPYLSMVLGSLSALASLFVATLILKKVMPASVGRATRIINNRQWISSALPMALSQGMHVFQGNASLLLLGFLSTVSVVGNFRVATSLVLLIGFPISLINMISGSIISRIYIQRKMEALQYLMTCLTLAMTIGTAIVTLPLLAYGPFLLNLVFGKDFLASNPPLQVLCFGMLLCSTLGANVVLLNMCGYERRVTRAFFIALIFLIVVGVPLIYFYGSVGAAIANATSMFLWNIILYRDARKLINIDTSILLFIRNPKMLLQLHKI